MLLSRIRVKRFSLAGPFLGCVLLFNVFVSSASAQAVAVAEIDGRVIDQSGAPVPNAQVRLVETDRAQGHPAVTDAQGLYTVPNLPVGAYRLEVTAPGFKGYSQTGIVLEVGSTVQSRNQYIPRRPV